MATKSKNPEVAGIDIVKAWERQCAAKDADGNSIGSIQAAADSVGMLKDSFYQRVQDIKGRGVKLSKMPRAKGGGRKVDVDALNDALADVQKELGL